MNENIIRTTYLNKEIWLVKTAHVSKNSLADVKEAFELFAPDAICVELDADRYASLESRDRWQNTDIIKVIKENKAGYLLVNTILASFQKRMAAKLDTQSGGEMLMGINYAKEHNLPLVLADRSINITFKRIWHSLAFKEKIKLLSTIAMSIFDNEEISEEDLTSLQENDALDAALNEVSKDFPTIKRILVDERDIYLAQKIKQAPGKRVLAIIGAAHGKGILKNLYNDYDLKQLEEVPAKKPINKLAKYLLPLLLIIMIIYIFVHNRDTGFKQLLSWLIWNGGLAAIGSTVAGGHLLTVLVSFFLAPLTSLSPLLAVGWFAGLCEAKIDSPKVKDFEDLPYDTDSFKGFRKNKVTKILMVVILANLGSTIGTFISGLAIFNQFISLL